MPSSSSHCAVTAFFEGCLGCSRYCSLRWLSALLHRLLHAASASCTVHFNSRAQSFSLHTPRSKNRNQSLHSGRLSTGSSLPWPYTGLVVLLWEKVPGQPCPASVQQGLRKRAAIEALRLTTDPSPILP